MSTEPAAGHVDTLSFQTVLYGNVTPTITLMPSTQAFHLKEVSGEQLPAKRTDDHLVAITIQLGDPLKGITAESTRVSAVKALENNRYLSVQEDILRRLDEPQ